MDQRTPTQEEMLKEIEGTMNYAEVPNGLELLRKTTCANCEEKGVSSQDKHLQRCTKCKFFRYCSKECQKEHWDKHKVTCSQFELAVQRATQDTMPAFYLYYSLHWIRVDEYFFAAKKHRENMLETMNKLGVKQTNMQASWVRLPIHVDRNNRHLVVYLSYVHEEEPTDQLFFKTYFVGPESVNNSNDIGVKFIKECISELNDKGIECTSVLVGSGFSKPGQSLEFPNNIQRNTQGGCNQ